MVYSNKKRAKIINLILVSVLLVVISVFLQVERGYAQEKLPETYTLTIHYPDGRMKTLEEVAFHKLIHEENTTFMSVILKDGRRFLFTVQDRDFEFSPELSRILEAESKEKAEE